MYNDRYAIDSPTKLPTKIATKNSISCENQSQNTSILVLSIGNFDLSLQGHGIQ